MAGPEGSRFQRAAKSGGDSDTWHDESAGHGRNARAKQPGDRRPPCASRPDSPYGIFRHRRSITDNLPRRSPRHPETRRAWRMPLHSQPASGALAASWMPTGSRSLRWGNGTGKPQCAGRPCGRALWLNSVAARRGAHRKDIVTESAGLNMGRSYCSPVWWIRTQQRRRSGGHPARKTRSRFRHRVVANSGS